VIDNMMDMEELTHREPEIENLAICASWRETFVGPLSVADRIVTLHARSPIVRAPAFLGYMIQVNTSKVSETSEVRPDKIAKLRILLVLDNDAHLWYTVNNSMLSDSVLQIRLLLRCQALLANNSNTIRLYAPST